MPKMIPEDEEVAIPTKPGGKFPPFMKDDKKKKPTKKNKEADKKKEDSKKKEVNKKKTSKDKKLPPWLKDK